MKRWLVLSLVLSATTAQGQAPASRLSQQLLSECSAALRIMDGQKSVDFIEASNCVGYIQGYRDGVVALSKAGDRACVPLEATAGQVARAIVAYLKENPESLSLDKRVGMQAALAASFPCK